MSKQYGLIIPDKKKSVATKSNALVRPSIFDEESDSEDEASKKPTGLKQALKKQDRVLQEKAMEEDPTIFQYDEVYDDIDQKRKQSKLARKDIDRKPKYISKLLQAAERRKQENERRIEREVERERNAEGEEFKDKESFVTSAYRKKLEEMKELEEKEKREEYLESIGDVRKQGNLDGFYRHLYDQKVNYGESSKDTQESSEIKEEPQPQLDSIKENVVKSPNSNSESPKLSKDISDLSKLPNRKKRKYRHRKQSGTASSDEEEVEPSPAETTKHIQSNLDADSDFSIDSGSDDEEQKEDQTKDESITEKSAKKIGDVKASGDKTVADVEGVVKIKDDAEVKMEEKEEVKEEKEEVQTKPKIDIWKKRTAGVVFEEALQRYFERKALRESNQL